MTKTIGWTFGAELEAAGLKHLPVMFTPGGTDAQIAYGLVQVPGDPEADPPIPNSARPMTPQEIASVQAVIAAHDAGLAVVPAEVTTLGLRIALARSGQLAAIEAAVAGLGAEAQIAWEYATRIERAHPLVTAAASAAGLTSQDIDAAFIAAVAATPGGGG